MLYQKDMKLMLSEYEYIDDSLIEVPPFAYASEMPDSAMPGGFSEAVRMAYDHHLPLIISPDMIWLLISQGLSNHISLNEAKYKKKVVLHDGVMKIGSRVDELVTNPGKGWQMLMDSLSDQASKSLNPAFSRTMLKPFSTTTKPIDIAYKITMLYGVRTSFEMWGMSGCGIPQITLTGQRKDWVDLKGRIELLRNYGLDTWAAQLQPILTEFVNVWDHKVNQVFWDGIYKDRTRYGVNAINGWMLKLYPYVKTVSKFNDTTVQVTLIRNPVVFSNETTFAVSLGGPRFPDEVVSIDVHWDQGLPSYAIPAGLYNVSVCAGFLGFTQHRETAAIEPVIGWYVKQPVPVAGTTK